MKSTWTRIILAALAVRLLAVWASPGYLMHDDHFLTVEPASSWAAGQNFNEWLPGVDNERTAPEPISFFYPGILAGLFWIMRQAGLEDPAGQMVVIRLLHALYSLSTVWFGMRIARHLGGERSALTAGWILALAGVLPHFSVRNLVEMVCQPPLMAGFWLLVRGGAMRPFRLFGRMWQEEATGTLSRTTLVQAAVLMGLAVGIRYQVGLVVAVAGSVFLLQRQAGHFLLFGCAAFAAFFLTQIDDVLLWGGEPFQHLRGYFSYNSEHAGAYPGSPLAYFSFLLYFLLPPASVMLLAGVVREPRRAAMLWLPMLAFILFHVLYPNRQERFLLPILPLFVVLGSVGWHRMADRPDWPAARQRASRIAWRIFWVINSVVLLVMCTTYPKRCRVEAMRYLHDQGDCVNFIHEFTHRDGAPQLPRHYYGRWVHYYALDRKDDLSYFMSVMPRNAAQRAHRLETQPVPNYVLFVDDTDLDQRVARMRGYFPELSYSATIEPGWFDLLLHRLNPLNAVERIHVYRVEPGTLPVVPAATRSLPV